MTAPVTLEIVVAIARNGVIGRGNELPWRPPSDLAHFKRVTLGHPVLMGRKTWDSLGRPLPGRRNLVLTRQAGGDFIGAESVSTIDEALQRVGEGRLMVIGGAELYRLALPQVSVMHLTRVHADVDGDVRFPDWSEQDWEEEWNQAHPADERHSYAYTFSRLMRRGR